MTSALHKRKRLDDITVADGFIEEAYLGQKVLGLLEEQQGQPQGPACSRNAD
jgi:hypothetical protein